jgi:MMP 1-O-methyltransferase
VLERVKTLDRYVQAAEERPAFAKIKRAVADSGMRCWLTPREMAFLYGLGLSHPGKGCMVEIGAFEGASAIFAAAGLKERKRGKLYSVDPHMGGPPYVGFGPGEFTFDKFKRNIESFGLSHFVRPIVADSVAAAAVWPATPIDVLLIDGDHSYLGALKDFESWVPKLRLGGLIIVDDVNEPTLTELKDFFRDLKSMRSIHFEGMIDGCAVFSRTDRDGFALLDEVRKKAAARGLARPWDMSYVQSLRPAASFAPGLLAPKPEIHIAYQFGFLARCEPGDYGITYEATLEDIALVRALAASRRDGSVLNVEGGVAAKLRFLIAPVDQVPKYMSRLLPGAVVIGRSKLELTEQNVLAERQRMIEAGLEACGFGGPLHWGFYKPHFVSAEAVAHYISSAMQPMAADAARSQTRMR